MVAGAVAVLELLLWAPSHAAACAPGAGSCPGRCRVPALAQTSGRTHTTSHTRAVGSSVLSTAVPLGAVGKHGTGWLQPAPVPALL